MKVVLHVPPQLRQPPRLEDQEQDDDDAEDRLLPAIRANPDAAIAAPGTSCRAQIGDAGFGARHPIEIVLDALDDC